MLPLYDDINITYKYNKYYTRCISFVVEFRYARFDYETDSISFRTHFLRIAPRLILFINLSLLIEKLSNGRDLQ